MFFNIQIKNFRSDEQLIYMECNITSVINFLNEILYYFLHANEIMPMRKFSAFQHKSGYPKMKQNQYNMAAGGGR